MKGTLWVLWEFQLRNALRSRWVLLYGGGLLLLTALLFRFGGTAEQVVVSLLNVVLLLVPLVALLYGVLGISSAREFLELMLAQPLQRQELFWGTFGGMALPLLLLPPLSIGIPWLVFAAGRWELLLTLSLGSMVLSLIGAAAGVAFALRWEERLHAIGVAFGFWFALTILYDGFILWAGIALRDYPIEHGLLLALVLNPVDLVRVATLLQLDAAALLGYTGAALERFAGSTLGILLAAGALALWCAFPLWLALRGFLRKDF